MANITAKTSGNAFYKARCEAARHNEALSSREGAAEIMSIDRGRLYRIERGIANPYPEEVRLMSDLYNAPELECHFCASMCPLGEGMPRAELADLDRISVKALAAFRRVAETNDLLLGIAEDGEVSDDEKGDMERVLDTLGQLERIARSLRIWARKYL